MVSDPPSSMLRAAPRKLLGRVERGGVNAAGEDAAARGLCEVVGAREASDGVKQHHDVLPHLDEALGALDHELGDMGVVLGGHVEG